MRRKKNFSKHVTVLIHKTVRVNSYSQAGYIKGQTVILVDKFFTTTINISNLVVLVKYSNEEVLPCLSKWLKRMCKTGFVQT